MIRNIKKIMGLLCGAAFCTAVAIGAPQIAKAEEIAINETNFPGRDFREYVNKNCDTNSDGKLSDEEIKKVTKIIINGSVFTSNFKGIEYFTALTHLECSNNYLTSLDISKNTALTYLDCNNNRLNALNISTNTALTYLECSNNYLTPLDVSKNTALTYLDCSHNNIKALDINTALTYLDCSYNQMNALNISTNTALTHLECIGNYLTSLDVSKNIALTYLDCSHNKLEALDISKNTNLTHLDCGNSYKKSSNNYNKLTKLDISINTALTYLDCCNNKLETLDVSTNSALTYLSCANNKLEALDVSKNTALEVLLSYSNPIKSLDISKNTALTELSCYTNDLAELDVSKNTLLTCLTCGSNKFTELDLSKNTALVKLFCQENQLTELDLSHNIALKEVYCYSSNLTKLKLHSKMYYTLPLYKEYFFQYKDELSDLKNMTETKLDKPITVYDVVTLTSFFKVTDITRPATYKINGREVTITYVDKITSPLPTPPAPSASFVTANCDRLFYDYNNTNPVSGSAVVIYGNGTTQTVDGKKVNNKQFITYTDICASYKYTVNNKGVVKPSVGKVVVGITKSNVKPEVNSKNKITDTSASKIAKATIKNGQIKINAFGKEGGLVYLWIIDTGNKGASECCPVNVQVAPRKLEVQNTSGNKLTNTKIGNGKTLDVCIAGIVQGSMKTNDCTYTATVDSKYQGYISVTPVTGSPDKFTIKATGLSNNKDTKAVVVFKCVQNGKKVKFSLTVTK